MYILDHEVDYAEMSVALTYLRRFLLPYRSKNHRKRGHEQLTPVPRPDGRLPPAELRPKTRDELLGWSRTSRSPLSGPVS